MARIFQAKNKRSDLENAKYIFYDGLKNLLRYNFKAKDNFSQETLKNLYEFENSDWMEYDVMSKLTDRMRLLLGTE
jgi:hypothetical protein